ncbi:MAG: ADP-glyceromanno-heptose 6-epimerase, partial [Bacteroidetes bacterium HGW-Bacteroidetes-22]
MIVVTGAAGFIGSCLISRLEEAGVREVVAVDDFTREDKNLNLKAKNLALLVDRMHFFNWLTENHQRVDFIFHLGARTDTTEFDVSVFDALNLNYTKELWRQCTAYAIPLIYASSAATYGGGELGYEDDHSLVEKLKPLNPYGDSKNEFDKWMLKQTATPPFWAGFKFFNVYGPNEYHKGRMASVVMHSFNQIRDTGRVKLFRSHRPDFADGMQLRDFIYVGDVVEVMYEMSLKRSQPGIYNLGTGTARAFLHL